MIKEIVERFKQGYRTVKFPSEEIKMCHHYLGLPKIIGTIVFANRVCPTGALSADKQTLNLGECIFCGNCIRYATEEIEFTKDYKTCASSKKDLILVKNKPVTRANTLNKNLCSVFKRSFKIRLVSAGGCGACEADCNVLGTLVYDLGRFGIEFTASPRHADCLLITGPVTGNMALALIKTYRAMPEPKVVIACGTCAVSGGIYKDSKEISGIPAEIQPDMYIPGCPPNPFTILDAILRLIGRIS